MKSLSPLLGFNNNVKHRGKVFHIQTEDSGVKHPHVITHLFVDGGRILKSIKTSYAEFLEDEQLTLKVRQLMQEQHKAMFIALRAGKFDHMVEGGDAPAPSAPIPASAPSSAGPAPTPSAPGAAADTPAAATPAAATPASALPRDRVPTAREPVRGGEPPPPPSAGPPPSSAPVTERSAPPSTAGGPARPPSAPVSLRPPSLMPPPPRGSGPSTANERAVSGDRRADPRAETMQALPVEARARLASPALELNLEALERASSEAKPSSVASSDLRDLPPPPAAVLGRRAVTFNTGYRSIASADPRAEPVATRPDVAGGAQRREEGEPESTRRPSPAPSIPGGPPSRPRSVATPIGSRSVGGERRSLTPQGARYAPSRPASIFGSARPQEGSSIFGEDLISEKSLDEVILSYLAEDLEGSKPKR